MVKFKWILNAESRCTPPIWVANDTLYRDNMSGYLGALCPVAKLHLLEKVTLLELEESDSPYAGRI